MNVDKYREEIVSVVRDAVIGPVPRLVATREWAADVLERALAEQREAIALEAEKALCPDESGAMASFMNGCIHWFADDVARVYGKEQS